jgi:hypothetical protein
MIHRLMLSARLQPGYGWSAPHVLSRAMTGRGSSVFLRQQQRCRAAIPFGDDPEPVVDTRPVRGEEASIVGERPLVFSHILFRQLPSIAMLAHKRNSGSTCCAARRA